MSEISNHVVRVIVNGQQIDGWSSYSISTGLLTPADEFRLERAFDRAAWDLCAPDAEVQIYIDKVQFILGYIDDREHGDSDDTFAITGRDKVGRLLQESAPTFSFAGLDAFNLVAKLAAPWYSAVSASNLRNRVLLRGKKGRVAASGKEPVVLGKLSKVGTRVEPGQTRWAAIVEILRQTGNLAWSTGNGAQLIVGQPNYSQEVQFVFFRPKPGSLRTSERNVLTMGERHSVGERYSRIDVVGSGSGSAVHYGTTVTSRAGTVRNNPATQDGDGLDFQRPKRLLQLEDVRSLAEAQEYARREMARRDLEKTRITVTAPLHGQRVAGATGLTYFAPDTLAVVENEASGLRFTCLIISCTFTTDRRAGEITKLELVPKGQELFL